MFEIPPILRGSEKDQIVSIRDYLVRLAFSLNQEEGLKNKKPEQDPALSAAQKADKRFNEVRELINYLNRLPVKFWPFKFTKDAEGVAVGKSASYDDCLQIPADWELRVGTQNIIFKHGSSYTQSLPCFGYVTNSGNRVTLYFVPARVMATADTVTATDVSSASIRTADGGYLIADGTDLTSYITSTARWGGTIRVVLDKNDGFGVTNNTPLTGTASVSFTVT